MKTLSSLHRTSAANSLLHTRRNAPLYVHLPPSVENFVHHLDRCSDIDSLKKVHAYLVVNDLIKSSIVLGSKLINSYARFGFLTESRYIFGQINNSLYLCNLVLAGYSKIGYDDEVLKLYNGEKKRGVDSYTVTLSLKSCIELNDLGFGRSLHGDSFKFGLNCGCFVGSSLIRLYCKCGVILDAYRVFDEIFERDVVVYTSLVTGYASVGGEKAALKAFGLVRDMQREGLEPNRVTLVSLLQAASNLSGSEMGKCVHGYAIRREIGLLDEIFETSLMDMYMKCGLPDKAVLTLEKMSRKTVGSWNALIAGHLHAKRPFKALQLLHRMIHENHSPDLVTLSNGLLSCSYLEDLVVGTCIHGYILRRNIQLDIVATTALIDIYSKCHHLTCAKEIFNRIETKDIVSFNVMMSGLLANGVSCQVTDLVREMMKSGLTLNVSTVLNLLCALSNLKDIRQGKSVHGYVYRHGFGENTDIANQLMNIYTKCYCMNTARQVFDKMMNRDVLSWTTMITGLVNHGLAQEAVKFFRLMQLESLKPDSVTFVSLLQGFSQLGCLHLTKEVHGFVCRTCLLDDNESILNSLLTTYSRCGKLKQAWNLFERMGRKNLSVWNSMISAYGMHGDCLNALKVFDEMKKENVAPDELTFRSLLSACSHSGYVIEGLKIFNSIKEDYDINPTDEHYGCVVDLLSRAGHLEEAYEVIKGLPNKESPSPLSALLSGCRVYTNTRIGEVIGKRLLDMETRNSSAYSSVSNLYAENENWDRVANLRGVTGQKGLESVVGYSSLVS